MTDIVDTPIDTTPEPQDEAQATETAAPIVDTPGLQVDLSDPPKDSTIDAPYGYNKDGTPAKKRGRKPKDEADGTADAFARLSSVRPAGPRPVPIPGQIPAPAAIPTDYKALGDTAANLWFNVGQIPFGDDWAPNTDIGEHLIISKGFRDYFQAKGVTQLDPTLSLCLVLGSYTLSRINKPTIKDKVSRGWFWLKSKMPKVK